MKKAIADIILSNGKGNKMAKVLAQFLLFHRERRLEELVLSVSKERCVLAGPFKGLQYGNVEGFGSFSNSKLLGTYEAELHDWIQGWGSSNYQHCVDIGAAEGYYAVGVALFFNLDVTAVDMSEIALERARNLARLNGVAQKISTVNASESTTLGIKNMIKPGSLIICDCEGFEVDYLLNPTDAMLQSDIMVELHERQVPGVSRKILKAYEGSHSVGIRQFEPTSSIRKAILNTINSKELSNITNGDLAALSDERTPGQKWAFLKSKNRHAFSK